MFDYKQLTVKNITLTSLDQFPQDILALRKLVYTDEFNYLREDQLISDNDLYGVHTCLYYKDQLIATAHVARSEEVDFINYSKGSHEFLSQTYVSDRNMIHPDFRNNRFGNADIYYLLLYASFSPARMDNRILMMCYADEKSVSALRALKMYPCTSLENRVVTGANGEQYTVVPQAVDINYGMRNVFNKMTDECKQVAAEQVIFPELEATVQKGIDRFNQSKWVQAVMEGTLGKNQYIHSMMNNHAFARFTTRLLGKAVAITSDEQDELRAHYVYHCSDEVNHERWIENDLVHLGCDIKYLINDFTPDQPIRQFMAIQESINSFYQDPHIFLSVPFAIEALTANLPKEFGKKLVDNVKSWGVESPQKACSFFISHKETDGRDETGHWFLTGELVKRYITTETQAKRCLNVINIVMDSLEAAYNDYGTFPDFS